MIAKELATVSLCVRIVLTLTSLASTIENKGLIRGMRFARKSAVRHRPPVAVSKADRSEQPKAVAEC